MHLSFPSNRKRPLIPLKSLSNPDHESELHKYWDPLSSRTSTMVHEIRMNFHSDLNKYGTFKMLLKYPFSIRLTKFTDVTEVNMVILTEELAKLLMFRVSFANVVVDSHVVTRVQIEHSFCTVGQILEIMLEIRK